MQENNPMKGAGQGSTGGNQNQKPSGLSWSQAPQGTGAANNAANRPITPGAVPMSAPSSVQKPLPTVPPMRSSAPMPSSSMKPNQVQSPKTGSNTMQWVLTFITGLVVGGLLGWVWFALRPSSTANMAAATATTTAMTDTSSGAAMTATNSTSSVASGITLPASGAAATTNTAPASTSASSATNAALTIPSPQASGLNVAVSNAVVSQPTWVVVYESRAGQPGNVLGAQMFFPGTTSGAVSLLRGTLPGQTYFVGESVDDGDHIFSVDNDKPVRNADGSLMTVQFQTN